MIKQVFSTIAIAASLTAAVLSTAARADEFFGYVSVKNVNPTTNIRCVQGTVVTSITPSSRAVFTVGATPDQVACNAQSSDDLEFFIQVREAAGNTGVESLYVSGALIPPPNALIPKKDEDALQVKVGGTARSKQATIVYPEALACHWHDGFCD